MAIISGTNLVVKVDAAEGTPVVIVCSTTCTLNLNQEMVEASCKDSGKWKSGVPGLVDWEITTDNLYDPSYVSNSFDKLAKYIIDDANGTAVNSLDIAFEVDNPDVVEGDITAYSGACQLASLSLTGDDNSPATYSATFTGVGALVQELEPAP